MKKKLDVRERSDEDNDSTLQKPTRKIIERFASLQMCRSIGGFERLERSRRIGTGPEKRERESRREARAESLGWSGEGEVTRKSFVSFRFIDHHRKKEEAENQMAAVLHAAGAGVVVVVAASAATDRRAGKGLEAQQQWSHVSCVSSSFWQRGSPQLRMIGALRRSQQQQRAVVVVKAAGEGVEAGVETKVSGDVPSTHEWPENFSLLNFEDLISHYEPALFKAEAQPGTYLGDVMSKTLFTAFPEQNLSEIIHFFEECSGIPIVDEGFKVVGVLSKKDRAKAAAGENPKVKHLMSSPAITLSADKTVQEAAVLMLKNKIHRIPIVNSSDQVVGIVTRTDIFTALETEPKRS